MIATTLIVATLASGLLVLSGYLLGSRREERERERLRLLLAESAARVEGLARVEELLASARMPERISRAVALLRGARSERSALPQLLDLIAEQGPFAAVLLTDESGLPVASSTQARHTEQLAGIASLILSLAERIVAHQQPGPIALMLRDESNQLILHRVFRLPYTEERYILTAVAKGTAATPEALDPALGVLEEMLAPTDAAA